LIRRAASWPAQVREHLRRISGDIGEGFTEVLGEKGAVEVKTGRARNLKGIAPTLDM
jgi:hypothetical protein